MSNTHADELRADLRVIADLIPAQSSVLDIGCGDGALLAWLKKHKQVDGRGIEIDQPRVNGAIEAGLSVIQGDVNTDLEYYPNKAVDVVVLSQALQAMQNPAYILQELMRIGGRAIVSVPNFGHWKNRIYLAMKGRMPVTKTLTYQWYDTPNIHFCTISDFVELCDKLGITVEQRMVVRHSGEPSGFSGKGLLANVFGEQGVFVLSKI